jgi:hypothetical protein
MDNRSIDRLTRVYDKEIKKDLAEIHLDKQKFIKEMRNGLGEKINTFETYVKKEPSRFQKLKMKIKRIFKAL